MKDEWDEFVSRCAPIAGDEEEVINLFVTEQIRQDSLSKIIGTVVRTDAGDMIFWENADDLRGRVQGEYWSTFGKRWVPLYDY